MILRSMKFNPVCFTCPPPENDTEGRHRLCIFYRRTNSNDLWRPWDLGSHAPTPYAEYQRKCHDCQTTINSTSILKICEDCCESFNVEIRGKTNNDPNWKQKGLVVVGPLPPQTVRQSEDDATDSSYSDTDESYIGSDDILD